ncbi:MAG: DivIVA domain-containing protein, partial [Thermoleophilia bacterium]|nr:DivIVA domain-containing protein [Thermoleophilia bacterium]
MASREGGTLTPAEIRSTELRRSWLGGYRRTAVHHLLEDVADALAATLRERDELADRVETLKAEVEARGELERLLASTLVFAEWSSRETREQARREADLLVREAQAEARRIAREAAAEKRYLEGCLLDLRTRLRSALGALDGSEEAVPSAEDEPPTLERAPGAPDAVVDEPRSSSDVAEAPVAVDGPDGGTASGGAPSATRSPRDEPGP